jgi:hypothetical protein
MRRAASAVIQARVGRDEAGHLDDHVECSVRQVLAAGNRLAKFAQEQDLCCLGRLIGVFPCPEALGIAAAARIGHAGAQIRSTDSAATFKEWKEILCGSADLAGAVG